MKLNYYFLSHILASFLILIFSLFVFKKDRKAEVNRSFFIFSSTIFIWLLFSALAVISVGNAQILLYYKLSYVGIIFIPPTFFYFISCFLRKKSNFAIIVNFVISTIFIFFLWFSEWLIKEIYEYSWGYYPRVSIILHPIFLLFFNILFIDRLISLFLKMHEVKNTLTPMEKARIKYVLLGGLLGIGGAIDFLPNYGIGIFPFGFIFMVIFPIIFGYAILKYRLMDIVLARQYLAIYLSYGVISLVLFSPLIFFFKHSILGLMITGFAMILLAPYLHRWMVKFIEPAFLGETHCIWEKLKSFWEKERVVYTAGQLAEILREIPQIMGLESFSFFLFESDRKVFVPRAYQGLDGVFDPEQAEVLNTIYPEDPLVMYLEKEKRIITRDELVSQSGENHQAVIAQMDELKAYISVPLFVAGRLTGILNLGPKKKKEMFHEQDLELIKTVAKTAEKHLSHISFFDSSIIFSGSVAHDIRKPFRQGIIFDYLANIRKGLEHPENISSAKESLDNLKHLLGNLHNMSEDMVDAFTNLGIFLKTGFKPQKIDYASLINKESKSFETIAQQKGIVFETALPEADLFLYVDPLSVQRILNELLTNAFKYTDKGCIKIKVSQHANNSNREILTEVTDTGCGIAEEDQNEIWELFKRGENGQTKEGEGIGLAMVRQLIEANGGKISLNSSKGNGSSFFFSLPAWEDKNVR